MDAFISARERAAQTASVLVTFLVAAMKYLAFQPAEERKTRSGSQFGAIHSILAGGKETAAAGGCSCGGGGGACWCLGGPGSKERVGTESRLG